MHNGSAREPLKDEVLRPIFEAHAKTGDRGWRTVLLAIFRPGLESLHRRKRMWDRNQDELWSNIYWTFQQVTCRIDVARRPSRLVQKVINDVIHYLYQHYLPEWKRQEREVEPDEKELVALASVLYDLAQHDFELRDVCEIEIERLQRFVKRGHIRQVDCDLILGTRLYGKSLRACAQEAGLTYEAAKKRRQRAEARIRRRE
jgi:hypothetical protein